MLAQPLLVAAIDFGTTYSGWAFSFAHDYKTDRRKADISYWYSGTGSLATQKTPTCILIRPDGKTVEAFGYEAEDMYEDKHGRGEGQDYYFFKHFKMKLHQKLTKKIDLQMTLEDESKKTLPAIQVFALAIKYLKENLLERVKDTQLDDIESDISWILTVPAIWRDEAKQFMKEAAEQAGIPKERQTIALEPEAASVFCYELPVEKTVGRRALSRLQVGDRYMIIDAGGGTIDITVHEVAPHGGLKEVAAASGGGWGGTMVDRAYEEFLGKLFGPDLYTKFKDTFKEDYLDFLRAFEVKKRHIKPNGEIRIEMPRNLVELFENDRKTTLKTFLDKSENSDKVRLVGGDKIQCSSDTVAMLFQESVQKTVNHVKDLQQNISNLKAILMVGGYSENQLLQGAIKSAFPNLNVVIPIEPQSAILRGALMYGHNPSVLTERVLKYTYGTNILIPFDPRIHPLSKKIYTDAGERCGQIFSKLVEKDQNIKTGQLVSNTFYPVNRSQRKLGFPVYVSEEKNPVYTENCHCIGSLTIQIPNPNPKTNLERAFTVSMCFGGTEIEMQAKDDMTGKKVEVNLNFLG
ncbi:heat shock 70 kDa protein 12B-like [Mercenaria mercenaria]|uniref:heat shock 70 kDa protein 12B-like n=1 Tax=Mercenaria mercenaria TaxID=6596 RepID=UPI00234E3D2F|nr:heat shock 70 kDa protein 12B-like [Mercenaria mercenaria]